MVLVGPKVYHSQGTHDITIPIVDQLVVGEQLAVGDKLAIGDQLASSQPSHRVIQDRLNLASLGGELQQVRVSYGVRAWREAKAAGQRQQPCPLLAMPQLMSVVRHSKTQGSKERAS